MPIFPILAGGLLLFVLALLLWPALRRGTAIDLRAWLDAAEEDLIRLERGDADLARYGAQRRAADASMRQRLLASSGSSMGRQVAAASAVVVIGGSAALYAVLGHPELEPAPLAASSQATVHAQNGPELQELAARLAARLVKSPDDLQGWEMLGRSYTALGRFDEATTAYAHAAAGPNPGASLLADYADALAAANGGKFDATAERLVARALQSDPHEPKALSLAGTIAYDQGDYPLAIQHWTLLATRLPEGSPQRLGIDGSLADARAAAGLPVERNDVSAAQPPPGVDPASPALTGVVRIAPRFAAQGAATDTLFVYVRRSGVAQGPPLAVRKLSATFPVSFTLSDADSMGTGARLSEGGRVTVSARISRDGSANPKPGDPVGHLDDVAPGARDLQLVINASTP